MTTRAAQRKAPAHDETPVHDTEGAILEPLNEGDAHMLLQMWGEMQIQIWSDLLLRRSPRDVVHVDF